MPYATNDQISQSPIEGGIEITQEQYQEALAGMQAGKVVTIEGGFAVIDPPEPETPEPEPIEPQPITIFSVREFRQRFTIAEQVAIRAASLTDMEVGLVYDDFQAAQFIDINDPDVAAGLDLYIAKGLLDPRRKATLVAAMQPQTETA